LLSQPKVVAVGEIGLDYHFAENPPREVQRAVFEKQVALANARGLPVIVHDRDAHGDTLALLKKWKPAGVVHCFSGSVETMREILKLGMYIGLGGAVTFKNARVPVA
ncbi:MAG TPA: hydrolase TatD, partial [Ruminococcaceae bacterium]|nr:hydrolase TatD [Oscillospiraceae bacterium]